MIKKLGALPALSISDSVTPLFHAERTSTGAINIQGVTLAERFAAPRGDNSYLRIVNLNGQPPAQPRSLGEMGPLDPALQDRFKVESLARDIHKRVGKRDIEEARDEAAKLALVAFWSEHVQSSRLRGFLARRAFYESVFAAHALRTVLQSQEFRQIMNQTAQSPSRARFLEELSQATSKALASVPAEEREKLFTSWGREVNERVGDIQHSQQTTLGGPAVDTVNTVLAGMEMMRRYTGKG